MSFCFAISVCVAADEETLEIKNVATQWRNDVYYLTARVAIELNEPLIEALENGVTLTFVYDISVSGYRKYWLNESLVSLSQRYELRYHALTEQYVLTNLNSGVQNNFPTLSTALAVLGTLVDLPVVDRPLLPEEGEIIGQLRARLDLNALPAPLRMLAYVKPAWWLTSDWYTWKLEM